MGKVKILSPPTDVTKYPSMRLYIDFEIAFILLPLSFDFQYKLKACGSILVKFSDRKYNKFVQKPKSLFQSR